ncbi:helix-turn-helix domain-containing protein [Allonocardiopsis opalescens]|uniref:AraC family transcriptional regulator n=1 Tax=Allonocardiopsis opalescens TaxID=1144618 RepID=A0A2T0Q420_9ACTN|nr:AraC family transcriptional regulator [Allonocardiopsis opalescens]PRX98547.1 AraC family transcriptional regulator [Allonocardiopsis opalescens]
MSGPAAHYTESAPPEGLARVLVCRWETLVGAEPRPVLPDGCTDLMWTGERLFVAGPDTGPQPVREPPGTRITGVRFAPGRGPALLGVPGDALRDARPDLALLWRPGEAERLADALAAAPDPAGGLAAAVAGMLRAAGPPEPWVAAVVRAADGGERVADLARRLGLSERQLHRRCLGAFGYGAKTLQRVLRFRRSLRLAGRPGAVLAEVAAEAGYADQSHLAREARALAGAPPAALR